ncbi:WGR domain-containing protein [Rubellimicrobium rubrum]|uniref:WGR domain-containing protein n=1 Tax=Rubellimicrobium rubrum TaxID=2585369 RepID=A0A5C4MJ25_9RHOB|nr:WGR domain-containing protein [Rubellimicrobium rubrum]TNC45234.1 WGR domain-containing protein [Rubellimicrobium rubrum]
MSEPEQLDLLDWLATQPPLPVPTLPEPAPVLATPDPAPLHLTRVDPSCNMRRFYSLALSTSLFGECGVVRHWGRIDNQGQRRTDWHDSLQAALDELARMARTKRRRGYR